MRQDTKSLQDHLEEFKTVGFTLFPKMYDDSWVKAMRDSLLRTLLISRNDLQPFWDNTLFMFK